MPASIFHIAVAIAFVLIFIAGNIFPDFEYIFHKGFFKNKLYNGFWIEPKCQEQQLFCGVLHNTYLWLGIIVFSFGCLAHILID